MFMSSAVWESRSKLPRSFASLRRESSKWIKAEQPRLSQFYWQAGYGDFSISPSHVPALREYIANQEEHHRQTTFQDEFRKLCKRYGLDLDERYAWD